MDTDSLQLALAHDTLYDCIRASKNAECKSLREHDFDDSITTDAVQYLLPRTGCDENEKHNQRKPGLFEEKFRCNEMISLCSKSYCCYDAKSDKYKLSSKKLKKQTLEGTGDGLLEMYGRVMEEIIISSTANRGFWTINHCVATYGQRKKGLP